MKQFFKYVFASMFGFLLAQGFILFISIFAIGLVIGLTSNLKEDKKVAIKEDQEKILLLNLSGVVEEKLNMDEVVIAEELSLLEDTPLGLYELEKSLEKAKDDDKVKGIFIKAGNLRSGWASLNAIRSSLVKFKESGKFIYAYGTNFSEATYYVVSVADTVFMYPEGYLEFNGFTTVLAFLKGLMEKAEIEPQVFRAGSYKSAVEPFLREDMSDANKEQITALNQSIWLEFSQKIAEARKISQEEVHRIAEKLLVTNAEEAKKYKLIDQIKYEDEVLDFLKGIVAVDEKDRLPLVSSHHYFYQKSNPGFSSKDLMKLNLSKSKPKKGEPRIAVIFAEGEIHSGKSKENTIGSRTYVEALRKIRKDDDVKAVVLRVNSPGGSALASDEIWREVVLTDKVKPVIASFGDIAASGGYYMAAGARKIFAQPSTVTGSIGVFGLMLVSKEMFKNKLGITFDQVVTHSSADMGGGHRKVSDHEKFIIEKEIDRIYAKFLSVVEKGRKISADSVKEVAEGRVWSGRTAVNLKLVDQLGGIPEALEQAALDAQLEKGDYKVEFFPKPDLPFERLFQILARRAQVNLGFEGLGDMFPLQKEVKKKVDLFTSDERGVFTLMPFEMVTR